MLLIKKIKIKLHKLGAIKHQVCYQTDKEITTNAAKFDYLFSMIFKP